MSVSRNSYALSQSLGLLFAMVMLIVALAADETCAAGAGTNGSCAVNPPAPTASITYTASDENFPNPERGFSQTIYAPWPDNATWDFCGQGNNFTAYNYNGWTPKLDATALNAARAKSSSIVEMRYHIFEFRQKPFSQAFLDRFQEDLDTARQSGYKLVPHFAYNWPKGGPDGSLDQTSTHLEQLKPVLEKNVDVIAFMSLGFVGCWGEQHSSSNGHVDVSNGYRRLTSGFRQIIDKAFAVLPKERMIVVRYPEYKFQYFNGTPNARPYEDETPITPLTFDESFSASTKARWGQKDDCVICGEWNAGTWLTPRTAEAGSAAEIRDFLRADNRYVVQHGEPGDEGDGGPSSNEDKDGDGYSGAGSYTKCERVLKVFEQERFSSFNSTYDNGGENAAAYRTWRSQGCYDTIAKKLGYRLQLVRAELPTSAQAGGNLNGSFVVKNTGWAAPYNPRGLELILRNKSTGNVYRVSILTAKAKTNDPRLWLPDDGEITASILQTLPGDLPVGQYDLLLNLPDPSPSLYSRPEYSIRLANTDIWEPQTGFNRLNATLEVKP